MLWGVLLGGTRMSKEELRDAGVIIELIIRDCRKKPQTRERRKLEDEKGTFPVSPGIDPSDTLTSAQ